MAVHWNLSWRRTLGGGLTLALLLGVVVAWGAPPVKKVVITADAAEVPELAEWAEQARGLAEHWHPQVSKALGISSPPVHQEIKLIVKKDFVGIAATSGGVISISAAYVKQHPDDLGMVIHEMTHAIQAYPKYDPPWLVEGLADYIRYWQYEPGAREFTIDPKKSSYKDAYGVTARFLAWVQAAKDEKFIHKLNAALRAGTYQEEIFQTATGKSLPDLWTEFVAATNVKP